MFGVQAELTVTRGRVNAEPGRFPQESARLDERSKLGSVVWTAPLAPRVPMPLIDRGARLVRIAVGAPRPALFGPEVGALIILSIAVARVRDPRGLPGSGLTPFLEIRHA